VARNPNPIRGIHLVRDARASFRDDAVRNPLERALFPFLAKRFNFEGIMRYNCDEQSGFRIRIGNRDMKERGEGNVS